MTISPEELAGLMERQWAALVAWVGRQHSWSEDVVQQAFLRLAVAEPAPENPAAWLFRVTRNLAHNQHRESTRRLRRERHEARQESVSYRVEASAEATELWRLLEQLEPTAREIVVAKIWGGLSLDEIAEAIGQSRSTVWRQYERSLQTLRQLYGVERKAEESSS